MTHPFDKDYFTGGHKVGGYAGEGYRDYPCHQITFDKVMELKPESVLEIGCARGYILKRLAVAGVHVLGLEISEHCRLTRAISDVITCDVMKSPWSIPSPSGGTPMLSDQSFDLCFSNAFLEHIPEDKLSIVFGEMARTCKRGLHGIDLHEGDGFDKTHCTIRDLVWWTERLPPGHVAVDKESLETGPLVLPPGDPGLKINIGCGTEMFHYGWRNIDKHNYDSWAKSNYYNFSCFDVIYEIPFDDEVVDVIYAGHFLDRLTYEEGATFLKECHRVLAPGGKMRVTVMDAEKVARGYAAGTLGEFDELGLPSSQIEKMHAFLVGDGQKAAYDWQALEEAAFKAGFEDFSPAMHQRGRDGTLCRETIDTIPDLSLILEAKR